LNSRLLLGFGRIDEHLDGLSPDQLRVDRGRKDLGLGFVARFSDRVCEK
jgi:hypothetical protein